MLSINLTLAVLPWFRAFLLRISDLGIFSPCGNKNFASSDSAQFVPNYFLKITRTVHLGLVYDLIIYQRFLVITTSTRLLVISERRLYILRAYRRHRKAYRATRLAFSIFDECRRMCGWLVYCPLVSGQSLTHSPIWIINYPQPHHPQIYL